MLAWFLRGTGSLMESTCGFRPKPLTKPKGKHFRQRRQLSCWRWPGMRPPVLPASFGGRRHGNESAIKARVAPLKQPTRTRARQTFSPARSALQLLLALLGLLFAGSPASAFTCPAGCVCGAGARGSASWCRDRQAQFIGGNMSTCVDCSAQSLVVIPPLSDDTTLL